MAFIYQYKKTLYFNLQKNQNLHELLYIYIIYIQKLTSSSELIHYKNFFLKTDWLTKKIPFFFLEQEGGNSNFPREKMDTQKALLTSGCIWWWITSLRGMGTCQTILKLSRNLCFHCYMRESIKQKQSDHVPSTWQSYPLSRFHCAFFSSMNEGRRIVIRRWY